MKEILKDSIQTHYDNEDYTEVIRDALLCLATEIRKKADLLDIDGVDLINKAFSEKQPKIKVNKLETTTDKNKQRGIADLSKGLIEYFRNPMSHEKKEYSKEVADAILVLLDKVILQEIMGSKSINSIEDWFLEIRNDLSPNTERYAKNLMETIPKNKCYELAVLLYKSRNSIIKKDKIIDKLVNNLTEQEFKSYCEIIERDLYGDVDEDKIISTLRFISTNIWNKLSTLAQSKIEDIALEDICKLYINLSYDGWGNELLEREKGYILENTLHILHNFSNLQELIKIIIEKATVDPNEGLQEYLFKKYLLIIINYSNEVDYELINIINGRLKSTNKPIWYQTVKSIFMSLPVDNEWYKHCAEGLELPLWW